MTTPPGRSPADGNNEIADVDGDGLPDLLVTKAGAYRAERSKSLSPAEFLAVDAQTLFAVFVDKQARRPLAKRRIDVVLPHI